MCIYIHKGVLYMYECKRNDKSVKKKRKEKTKNPIKKYLRTLFTRKISNGQ